MKPFHLSSIGTFYPKNELNYYKLLLPPYSSFHCAMEKVLCTMSIRTSYYTTT